MRERCAEVRLRWRAAALTCCCVGAVAVRTRWELPGTQRQGVAGARRERAAAGARHERAIVDAQRP